MCPSLYIGMLLVLLTTIRWVVVLINYLARPILPHRPTQSPDKVSILIPARNEAHIIGRLLKSIRNQSYSNVEVIVYNDCSTDSTAEIVGDYVRQDSRFALVHGEELPPGWLGKNYACHKLAQRACGKYFLFLDADVEVSPWLVGNALAYMQRHGVNLLSMFPNQVMESLGERLVVPSMNWILLSLLPLPLVKWSRKGSLSAANGQMMMFDAESYNLNLWHERVRGSTAEDISIARRVKRSNLTMATLLGSDDVYCRMYTSYPEAVTGFSKNYAAFFGGNIYLAILFVALGVVGLPIVLVTLPFPLVFVFLTCLLTGRMMVSKLSGQSVLLNIFLWPAQHVALFHVAARSLLFIRGGSLLWKGRAIKRIT